MRVLLILPSFRIDVLTNVLIAVGVVSLYFALLPYPVYLALTKFKMRRGWQEPPGMRRNMTFVRLGFGAIAFVAALGILIVWIATGDLTLARQ